MEYKTNDNELIYMIRENDEAYFKTLAYKYKPIIYSIIKDYYSSFIKLGLDLDDLIQECNIALYSACKSFNTLRNVKFYTYASICIRNHMKVCYRNMSTKKYMLLNNALSIDDVDYNENFYDFNVDEFENDFVKLKNLFDDKCSSVFELRYNGFSYKEISTLLDIPISTVDGRMCKIRTILRK